MTLPLALSNRHEVVLRKPLRAALADPTVGMRIIRDSDMLEKNGVT